MELWIRSQDRMNLVQIKQISLNYQNNKQVIANYEPEQYENSDCFYELLGTYASKERALEVLDEIQNILFPKFKVDTSSIQENGRSWVENGVILQSYTANVDYIKLDTCVYEMPKE